jgi:hypothetical protein
VPAAPRLLGSTGSTTFVLASALVVLGIAMICVTVWLVRATRTDTPALGPLEVMGDRRFHRDDAEARQRALTAARPAGAPAPAPMLEPDEVVAELPPAPGDDVLPPVTPEPVAADATAEPAASEPEERADPVPASPDAVTGEEPVVIADGEPLDEPLDEPQPAESA